MYYGIVISVWCMAQKGKEKTEFYDRNGERGYKGRENFCKEWLLLLSYKGMNVS